MAIVFHFFTFSVWCGTVSCGRTRQHCNVCIAHMLYVHVVLQTFSLSYFNIQKLVVIGYVNNDPFKTHGRGWTDYPAILNSKVISVVINSYSLYGRRKSRLVADNLSRTHPPLGSVTSCLWCLHQIWSGRGGKPHQRR